MAAAGMQTFLSHDGRGRPGDDERARVANLMDADLMISLRCGHYRNTRANGVASFYFGNSNSYSTIGRNLAGFIQREIAARTLLSDSRTHERTWDLLRLTKMPVALIDVGYITNPDDAAVLADSDWRNVIADAIVVAVKTVVPARPGRSPYRNLHIRGSAGRGEQAQILVLRSAGNRLGQGGLGRAAASSATLSHDRRSKRR